MRGVAVLFLLFGGCDTLLKFQHVAPAPDAPPLSAYAMTVLADQPIAYWPLDDAPGAPTITDVMGLAIGIPAGNCGFGAAGALSTGTAASFDGTSCSIDVGDHPELAFVGNAPYSIEAWVNPAPSMKTYMQIVARETRNTGGGPLNGYALVLRNPTLAYSERCVNSTNVTTVPDETITTEEWHFVVTTYDGALVKTYVDGVATMSGAATDAMPAFAAQMFIGATSDGKQLLAGVIDEVAAYDHVLAPDRVLAHFNARN